MRRRRRGLRALAAGLGLLLPACSGGPGQPTSASRGETLVLRFETAHFRLYGDRASDALLHEVADALEATLPRVLSDLSVGALRPVSAKVWQDEASFAAELQRFLGRPLSAGGYVTGPEELRVLALPQVARNASHELCHVVSLYVNPALANNPRWLWETVALYENGEFVDPRSLDYLVRGAPPSLAQLDADVTVSRQIYEVGYLLGEFVVERWGRDGFLRLIRAGGDTRAALGLSAAEFEAAWFAWVRERYLS